MRADTHESGHTSQCSIVNVSLSIACVYVKLNNMYFFHMGLTMT